MFVPSELDRVPSRETTLASVTWFSEDNDKSIRFYVNNLMNNKDIYSLTTTEVTRDFQKYGWPLQERSYGVDMRINF